MIIIIKILVSLTLGYPILFGALVALSTYQSFYPVCLIVPGLLHFAREGGKNASNSSSSALKPLVSFVVTLIGLLLVSAEIAGDWQFLEATYGFMYV